MRKTILYPFIEEAFSNKTLDFIEELSWLHKSKKIDLIIVVDKKGKTSKALKNKRLEFIELPFKKIVGKNDFYLTAIFKLFRSTLGLFFFFRQYKIDAMHCGDISSLLCWGSVAKMNKIPAMVSLNEPEKLSYLSSLIVADSRKIVCASEEVKAKTPSRFSHKILLAPRAEEGIENINAESIKTHTINFWVDLYDTLNQKISFQESIGLYK